MQAAERSQLRRLLSSDDFNRHRDVAMSITVSIFAVLSHTPDVDADELSNSRRSPSLISISVGQWLKWFCEAGGGAHLTKPGWSKPHTYSNPTNLALFRHKITLYRFNQGAHTIAGGGLKWEQGG